MFDCAKYPRLFHASQIYQFKKVFHNLHAFDANVQYIHAADALDFPQHSRHIIH